jgi:uncharacterized protein (TIGR02266 family)
VALRNRSNHTAERRVEDKAPAPRRAPLKRTKVARPRRVAINLEFDSLAKFTSYVSNISQTGCFMRTRDPWPVGTRLRLRFTVLADDPEVLQADGDVVRVSERPRGMGIKFASLSASARLLINRLLARSRLAGK